MRPKVTWTNAIKYVACDLIFSNPKIQNNSHLVYLLTNIFFSTVRSKTCEPAQSFVNFLFVSKKPKFKTKIALFIHSFSPPTVMKQINKIKVISTTAITYTSAKNISQRHPIFGINIIIISALKKKGLSKTRTKITRTNAIAHAKVP